MTKIQIRKVNGVPMGRPVNPFYKYLTNSVHKGLTTNPEWAQFEQSVTEHEAPGFEEGEADGVLIWQSFTCKVGGSGPFWLDVDKGTYQLYKSFEDFQQFYANPPRGWGEGIETRQIWRIVSTPEKVEVKEVDTEQQLLDQPKEQVIERQFKNNCDYGFKQPNVNKFIRMAFESGFENGMNYQKYSNHTDTKKPPSPHTH